MALRMRGRPRQSHTPLTADQIELTSIRQALGLTQDAWADALGVTNNTVSRWERGERPVTLTVLKLARLLKEARRDASP